MKPNAVWLVLTLSCARLACAAAPLAGASAPRWRPQLTWVRRAPAAYDRRAEEGRLVFTASGRRTELPWRIELRSDEIAGEPRYLLVRYRGRGLKPVHNNYFLHGVEASGAGHTLAFADEIIADGQWHDLAVDLLRIEPLSPITALALKVIVGDAGQARLEIERIQFVDRPPEDARVSRCRARPEQVVRLDWPQVRGLQPAPSWIGNPATKFSARRAGRRMVFRVEGAGKGMRWTGPLPEAVDLAALPYVSVRYRARGALGPYAYVLWLGTNPSGTGGASVIPFSARALTPDGLWRSAVVKLSKRFKAGRFAIGLDCVGDSAEMELDSIVFSSKPPRRPLADTLPFAARAAAWPAGREGFFPLALPAGERPAPFFRLRLGVSGWFASRHLTVRGIPFELPRPGQTLLHTGGLARGTLAFDLPPAAREIYLLTAVACPPWEFFGLNHKRPRPLDAIEHSEQMMLSIEYDRGPPDYLMPIHLASGRYGLWRGVDAHVAHPDPKRRPRRLVLHDFMQTADFAVLAATARVDAPRVPEPQPFAIRDFEATPAAKSPNRLARVGDRLECEAGRLRAAFSLARGVRWERLAAADDPGALRLAPGPLFSVAVDGATTTSDQWRVTACETSAARAAVTLVDDARRLQAALVIEARGALRMKLTLRSTADKPRFATVRFPIVSGVVMGDPEDTWYLFGRRGGVIHNRPASFREPLGEPHPLQADGFFSGRSGDALACLTLDTQAQHHFILLSKGRAGAWSIEYPDQELAPGRPWTATTAALQLRRGGWRGILAAYREWLDTWFRPPKRKDWFLRTFMLLGTNLSPRSGESPRARGDIERRVATARKYLGRCEYVHMFGWGASRRFGTWGDYSHYDEIGGLDYFRSNIARLQARGIGCGLYFDAYLLSAASQLQGRHAREWAMMNRGGKPRWSRAWNAYTICPYIRPWREHLARTYARVQRDLRPKGMYIDEYGATDGRWKCYAADHGHPPRCIPYCGEVDTMAAIRRAVGPDVALYTEYPPADAARTIVDGSFSYYAIRAQDQARLAPHFADLPRFVFPQFKHFHILSYVRPYAGNWRHFKIPFFNGEGYDVGEPGLPYMEDACLKFLRRALGVLAAHRDAFASRDCAALVPTLVPGVFANRFRSRRETVWTLYNATGREARGPVLRVRHAPGARYEDAWRGRPLSPRIEDGYAVLDADILPLRVGCLVQRRKRMTD